MPHRLERVSWWGSSPKDEGTSHPCPSLPPLHYCTVHWFTTKGSNKLLSGAAPPTSVSIAVALLVTQKKTLLHGLQPLLLYLVSLFLLWQRIEGQQILTPTSNVASVSSFLVHLVLSPRSPVPAVSVADEEGSQGQRSRARRAFWFFSLSCPPLTPVWTGLMSSSMWVPGCLCSGFRPGAASLKQLWLWFVFFSGKGNLGFWLNNLHEQFLHCPHCLSICRPYISTPVHTSSNYSRREHLNVYDDLRLTKLR